MSDWPRISGTGRLWYERAGRGFPGASKRVVAETDQLVNVDEPDRFNRLALDFLAFAG